MLTTPRLTLRPVHLGDCAALMAIFGDAEVMRYGDGVQHAAWVDQWVRRQRQQEQEWGFGVYGVVERQQRQLIGYCGLFAFPDVAGQPEIEIGYRLARMAWGQGYATEAAQAVCSYAFEILTLPRLIAMIDPHNQASIRVATKLGMRYDREVMFEGYSHPDHVYLLHAHAYHPPLAPES